MTILLHEIHCANGISYRITGESLRKSTIDPNYKSISDVRLYQQKTPLNLLLDPKAWRYITNCPAGIKQAFDTIDEIVFPSEATANDTETKLPEILEGRQFNPDYPNNIRK